MFVIIATVCGAVWCATEDFFKQNKFFQQHLSKVNELPCREPQKRMIYLHDLVNDKDWEDKYKDKISKVSLETSLIS